MEVCHSGFSKLMRHFLEAESDSNSWKYKNSKVEIFTKKGIYGAHEVWSTGQRFLCEKSQRKFTVVLNPEERIPSYLATKIYSRRRTRLFF